MWSESRALKASVDDCKKKNNKSHRRLYDGTRRCKTDAQRCREHSEWLWWATKWKCFAETTVVNSSNRNPEPWSIQLNAQRRNKGFSERKQRACFRNCQERWCSCQTSTRYTNIDIRLFFSARWNETENTILRFVTRGKRYEFLAASLKATFNNRAVGFPDSEKKPVFVNERLTQEKQQLLGAVVARKK